MIKSFVSKNIKMNLKNYLIVISVSLVITLLMSIVAPFLVKSIIDDNVLTNSYWQVSSTKTNVKLNNEYYKKGDSHNSKQLIKKNDNYYLANQLLSNDEVKPFLTAIFNNSIKIMGLFFITFIFTALMAYLADYNLRYIARKTIKEQREACLNLILKLDINYYDKNNDGSIITSIINDTQNFYRLLIEIGTVIINAVIVYTSITIVMAFLNFYLFIIALLLLPITLIWMKLYIKKVVTSFELQRDSLTEMNNLTNEQIYGIELIKTFQYEKRAETIFEKQAFKYYDNSKKALVAESTVSWTLVTLLQRSFILLVVVYFGLNHLNHGELLISAGFIYLIIHFINSITYPLVEIIHMLNAYNTVMVSLKRLNTFLATPTKNESLKPINLKNSTIEFKDVCFSYDRELVLDYLSLKFKANAKNAIVGATGSGKSTIISLIMKYYDYQRGQILIDNQDIKNHDTNSLRQQIGLVLQKTYLFEGSIYDNIVLDGNYSEAEVLELAEIAKADFIYSHPEGLKQRISENSNNLSLGQKQIVALLRALIRKPKIVILDEASSNLDMESEQAINNLIDYYSKNATIIIVAHRIATIASCDQIYVIEQGKLVEQGSHHELVALKQAYYKNIKSLRI